MSDLSAAELAAYQRRIGTTTTTKTAEPVRIDPTAGTVRSLTYTATPTTTSLTDVQLATLRSELGADIDVAEMEVRWQRLGDVRQVVLEVVRERLAGFAAGPAQFSVSGVYSQSTGDNIRALREQLARVAAESEGGETVVAEVTRTRTKSRRSR